MRMSRFVILMAMGLLSALAAPAGAVLVLNSTSTAASRNTTTPLPGEDAFNPWRYQGNWGIYSGTAIAPSAFITAKHAGGFVGMAFQYGGIDYTTDARTDIPDSDLTVWHISGVFPYHASIYTGSNEVNANAIILGRGTAANGAEVRVDDPNNVGQTLLRGWAWGTDDHAQSWGPGTIAAIANSAIYGNVLVYPFAPNQSTLTGGDSGGGVFINDGGTWKLAGVNLSTDGRYKVQPSDTPFNASIFNQHYLYVEGPPNTFNQVGQDVPGYSYSTRVSNRATEIMAAVPEPGTLSLLVLAAAAMTLRRRR